MQMIGATGNKNALLRTDNNGCDHLNYFHRGILNNIIRARLGAVFSIDADIFVGQVGGPDGFAGVAAIE